MLEKKKWDKKEIKKAARIFHEAEKKKSVLIKILDELVHWMIALVVILGNIIIA